MPFTLAHPAATVPFNKPGLPFSALAVGSMAPDFPYFLPDFVEAHYGHTGFGLFLFCLPVGLIGLWLFHRVLKLPLLSLFPTFHQERLGSVANTLFRFGPPRHFLLLVAALLLGACTHERILWDSFTHSSGWSVQHFPLLRLPMIQTSYGTIFVFKALQHGSTAAGITLMLFWYFRWLKQAPVQPVGLPLAFSKNLKFHLLVGMISVALVAAVASGTLATESLSGIGRLQPLVRLLVLRGGALLSIELLVYSGLWHLIASQKSFTKDLR